MKPLRVMTRDFQLITEISLFESLQLTRSWHGIGELQLKINRYLPGANELTRGRILFPGGQLHKGYVIRHRSIELDENGKQSENWNIVALPLKSWLSQRITEPPDGVGYDIIKSNTEDVMKHYVNTNTINPLDTRRIFPNLLLAATESRGNTLEWSSRYKILSEELTEISKLTGFGWNIHIDVTQLKYIFDVQFGKNLTVNQNELPPAIFSPKFNSVGKLSYTESDLNYRNAAIVAGQGEGVERRIVKVGESEGFDRHELFVDARDVEEVIDDAPIPVQDIVDRLMNRGQQKLAEQQHEFYLEGQTLQKSPLEYEIDYDLGDIVTLQNEEWGVTLDTRITEVKEIFERDGRKIELIFGNNQPTLVDKIKQGFSVFKPEMTR